MSADARALIWSNWTLDPSSRSTDGFVTTTVGSQDRIHSLHSGRSTIAIFGRASDITWVTSSARYAPLVGTTTAPNRSAAAWAATSSTELAALKSTRSPSSTPTFANRLAMTSDLSNRSPALIQPREGSWITVRSGWFFQLETQTAGSVSPDVRSILDGSNCLGRCRCQLLIGAGLSYRLGH